MADSRTPLGRTGVGVAIAEGKRKPDFSTVDAFRRELLDAKAIATSGEGSSGRYVLTLLDRLGIAAEVKPKIKSGAAGDASRLIARGEVDFAVIGLPPLVGVPGVVWLGYLPAEIQSWLVFTAGISTAAKEPAAARALLSFLVTPPAAGCGRPRAWSRCRIGLCKRTTDASTLARSTSPTRRAGPPTARRCC